MSFLKPKPDNPVTKYIEWKGSTGDFQYWDKEKEGNVKISLPISFLVLNEYSTVKGFSDAHQCGVYSNEVLSLQKETLNVRTFKGGVNIIGLWNDIKGRVTIEGGKFAKSVYAVLFTKDSYEIVNFSFAGSSIGSWIDKGFSVDNFGVTVKTFTDEKKGAAKYKVPVFEKGLVINDKVRSKPELVRMATTLQEYLDSRATQQTEKEHVDEAQAVVDAIDSNGKVESVDDFIPKENSPEEILKGEPVDDGLPF